MIPSSRPFKAVLLLGWLALPCAAFLAIPTPRPISTSLALAKRKGGLGSIVDAGESVPKTARTVPKKRSKRVTNKKTKSKKEDQVSSTISPLLQEWASGQQEENDDNDDAEEVEDTSSDAATFARFDDDKSKKRKTKSKTKKSQKQVQDEDRKALVLGLVEQIEQVLDDSKENNQKTSDMTAILDPLRQLLALPNANTNLRQLIAGTNRQGYRLTWVGSDAAICHVGTGLHNVPLARLQEVFLSCVGKSRLEVFEVIRIIGPFPNVRNTLEGSCKIGKRNLVYNEEEQTVSELAITYDSMIDGTGKQITAGAQDNVRRLMLHIAFCDENAIVAVVPNEDGGVRQDPLEDNGANVLFFAREETLDEKLDALRVL